MQYTGVIFTFLCVCSVALASRNVVKYKYEVVSTHPHDGDAFTQGLQCDPASKGCSVLYESTGLHGKSSVRRVETATGRVLTKENLPNNLFGEGLTLHKGALYQTTWKEHVIRQYDPVTLQMTGSSRYVMANEGWGLTSDGGEQLIASSGSSTLVFFTIEDGLEQKVKRSVDVRLNGRKLTRLNELEYARGHVWANVWFSDTIYEIDPATGDVVGEVDLSALHSVSKSGAGQDNVLNGIAYDAETDEFLVTGKNWYALHRIRVINPKPDASEL